MPLYHIICADCATPFSHLGYSTRKLCDACQQRHKAYNAARRSAAYLRRKQQQPDYLQQNREAMRRWRANNPEKARLNQRNSYARHQEANKAKMRERYRANRERAKAYHHEYYIYHRDEVLQQIKQWRENNRERSRLIGRKAITKRRALFAGLVVEDVDIPFIIKRDRGICGICAKPIQPGKETLDHIIPVSLGGPHTPQNLRIAHESCNKSRGPGRTPGQLWLL